MEPDNDNAIRKIYRDHIVAELARPEIQKEKEKLASFFEAPSAVPVLLRATGVLVPALILCGVFFFMVHFQPQVTETPRPSVVLDDPVRNHMKPRVVVKRISSRVGPTLVYQKTYRETPVTIIWVFAKGGPPV